METKRRTFSEFYHSVYLPEHSLPKNRMAHHIGTLLGTVYVIYSAFLLPYLYLLLFPVVHALPGLVGHFFFERNEKVGNLRVGRRDFPLWWFILGNYRLFWECFFSTKTQTTST
jgi:hypothetical protein